MSLSPSRASKEAPGNLSDLVSQVDLNQLVSRYTGNGRTSGKVTTYSCPHPAHPDTHPSFTVTTNGNGKEVAKCFSQCAWHGDALELVKWLEGLSTGEAASWLRRFIGQAQEQTFYSKKAESTRKVLPLYPQGEELTGESAERFMKKYLASRGWPCEVAEKFSLSVVLDSSGKARIRHPYFTPTSSGEWVLSYYQDRGDKTSLPKWKSPKGSIPQLFNLKSLEADSLEGVVICEGAADTITASLALEGCPFVAVIGVPGVSAWRDEWSHFVNGLRIVVAADNDEAGRTLEQRIRNSVKSPVTYVRATHGDLTEIANEIGLESLRALLLTGLGELPEATPRTLDESTALLLAYFPEACEVLS
jgi:DNA primase